METLFKDRVLLLSGASGIAAATARLAAREGAKLFIVSLEGAECAALRDEVLAVTEHCFYLTGDLAETGVAEQAVAACVERYGRIDALFNVAGGSGRRYGDGPLHECSDDGFDATLRINLRTLFLLSRATLRQMLLQERRENGQRGAILNMATVTAYSPQRDFFATHAYAAAKAGVIGLTTAAASYYAQQGIRINAIAPGLVRTPMSRRAQTDEKILTFMEKKQPLAERLIEPEDVARTALFLLSDFARMTTGEIVSIDAGWHVSG
ncbi:MAG: SDR family oxidoreductase [Bryobacterales bacterium]|nr:SDR family oxidoreductase [Bryobacterales bacterium]